MHHKTTIDIEENGRYAKKGNNKRKFRNRINFASLTFLYVFGAYLLTSVVTRTNGISGTQTRQEGIITRKLLSFDGNGTENCTEPSISEFPKDIFTQKQRRHGGILLHVLFALYMFLALAFVCDDYFISALEAICEKLDLSEDVAGATFMAAGSSAPELFTSIIGVFIAKGDVGVGTIVGSAVFNILVIIALCCLFAGQVVHLTWWPLCRDSLCYAVAICALIWTIYDGKVSWYESLVMLILYAMYILIMKLNPAILKKIESCTQRRNEDSKQRPNSSTVLMVDGNTKMNGTFKDNHNLNMQQKRRLTWKELGMMIMLTDRFAPSSRFRAACLIVILRGNGTEQGSCDTTELIKEEIEPNQKVEREETQANGVPDVTVEQPEVAFEGKPFLYPQNSSCIRSFFWLCSLPLVTILYFTIPDCRKARWESWYMVTFIISIVWIMIFSYLLVWMVSVIGFSLGIPDVIMGVTFLAAGTSIPDAISSLLVAREGMGDMAVSNSIGSNVFDILIGLSLPWFIQTAIVKPGALVHINSRGMIYSVCLLFGSVILTVLLIHCNKWRLTRPLGGFFVAIYLVFVSFSACIEFNVFGFVNYPPCPFNG